MIDLLIDSSIGAGMVVLVLIIMAISLVIYLTTHYLIKNILSKNHERVGRILFRVAASLLGLILSITFANQRVMYFSIKSSIEQEAAALVDVKVDLDLYNSNETDLISTKIIDYVLYVATDGWKSIEGDPFHSRPFVLFREIYADLNNLEPKTPLQERLKDNMLNDIDHLSDYLQVRLYSYGEKSNALIYISVIGLIGIMILFAVNRPDRLTIGLLLVYVSFIGVVLYFILMMSNPLKGPLQIEPQPFLLLKETIEANTR